MRRAILPALLLLLSAVPSEGQSSRNRGRDAERTVAQWYQRFLDRQPDRYAGGWVQALQQGQDPDQVLAGILGSDEYYKRAGGRPERFVRQLHEDLGQRATPRDVDYWARQAYSQSRTDVAYSILTRQAGNWDRDRDRDWRDDYDYRRRRDR